MSRIGKCLIAIVALSIAAGFIVMARRGAAMTPTSDTAVIETFTRLAVDGNLRLGPYSRFQWHHPGPMYFYAMAPAFALAGGLTTGLNAAAALVNLAALAVGLWWVSRRASSTMGVAIAIAIVVFVTRVPDLLVSPWNAHIPVIAMLAALVCAAAAIAGEPAALPWVAVLSSLAGQTHVGLLPLAMFVGVAACVGFAIYSFSDEGRAADLEPHIVAQALALTTVAVAVVWAPALYEQFTNRPGNLGRIWDYFAGEPHHGPTFGAAVSAWSDMIAGPLRRDFYLAHGWPFVESPVRWAEAVTGLEMVALLGALWLAWRERRRFDAALSGLLLGASAVALWSATRIDGEIFDHAVFWMAAIGTLNLAVVVSLAARVIAGAEKRLASDRTFVPVAAGLALAVAVLYGVSQLSAEVQRSFSPPIESLVADDVAVTLQRVFRERGWSRPLIRFDQDAWGMAAGVVLQLQREGVAVAVEDDWMAMYTPAFQPTGQEWIEVAIVGRAQHERMNGAPAAVIASSRELLFAHVVKP